MAQVQGSELGFLRDDREVDRWIVWLARLVTVLIPVYLLVNLWATWPYLDIDPVLFGWLALRTVISVIPLLAAIYWVILRLSSTGLSTDAEGDPERSLPRRKKAGYWGFVVVYYYFAILGRPDVTLFGTPAVAAGAGVTLLLIAAVVFPRFERYFGVPEPSSSQETE